METSEAPSKGQRGAEGTVQSTAEQGTPRPPPAPRGRGTAARPYAEQPSASRFVPIVAHFGGCDPNSFKFLFYTRNCSNSYSPFYTMQRPTCGYFFHYNTDHTRKVIDVQSSNIVKWRPVHTTSHRAKK